MDCDRGFFLKLMGCALVAGFVESISKQSEDCIDPSDLDSIVCMDACTESHPDDDLVRIIAVGKTESGYQVAFTDDFANVWVVGDIPEHIQNVQCVIALDRDHWMVGCGDGAVWHTLNSGESWVQKQYTVLPIGVDMCLGDDP
jgi:hypothetical protein